MAKTGMEGYKINTNKDDSDRYLMTPLHSATLLKFDVRRKADDQ